MNTTLSSDLSDQRHQFDIEVHDKNEIAYVYITTIYDYNPLYIIIKMAIDPSDNENINMLIDYEPDIPGHNVFNIGGVIFSSHFDNGNLLKVERLRYNEYKIWTASDNLGKSFQAKGNNAWFHFSVRGLTPFYPVKIHLMTPSHHSGLYKNEMVS